MCVSTASWKLKVRIKGQIDGFGDGARETTYIVPVSVAVRRYRGEGAWFWALPMDTLPHPRVSLVLDYTTVTLLFEKLDFSDPSQVRMQTRSREGMERMIEFFRKSDMRGTLTECAPREYALADFDIEE